MLLLIMFESFSTAFYQHSFTDVSHQSIIFLCFFNFGIYLFFTVLCYIMSRPSLLLFFLKEKPDESSSKTYKFFYDLLSPFYYNREDTVSVLLCGGAKTAALGVTLISSQYGNDNPHLGELLVPCVLYQAIQVIAAGFLTTFMKKWIHAGPEYKEKMRLKEEEETSENSEQKHEIEQEEEDKDVASEFIECDPHILERGSSRTDHTSEHVNSNKDESTGNSESVKSHQVSYRA